MQPCPFKQADVDYLLKDSKLIIGIPKQKLIDNLWVMEAQVYKASQPNSPIKGLYVQSRVAKKLAGLPSPTPSAALVYKGLRIRGIDRNVRHDNPDGSHVAGWHEHRWSAEHHDSWVYAIKD